MAGVIARRIGRRRGRGKPYTATTVADYVRSYRNFLRPEFGPFAADDIGEVEWQMWVDRLSREGLSRSRITTHVAVASAIYAWAIAPTRRLAERNPLRLVELPPTDEKPRLRVAFALEAEQLLDTLTAEDAVPYAIAFYSGLRRAEIARLECALWSACAMCRKRVREGQGATRLRAGVVMGWVHKVDARDHPRHVDIRQIHPRGGRTEDERRRSSDMIDEAAARLATLRRPHPTA